MMENGLPYNENIDKKIISKVLQEFVDTLNYEVSEQEWFNNLKALAVRNNFAESAKIYKQNKELYLGSVNDIAEMVRISLTTSKQSPNIYYVLRILGKEEIERRISKSIEVLNK